MAPVVVSTKPDVVILNIGIIIYLDLLLILINSMFTFTYLDITVLVAFNVLLL